MWSKYMPDQLNAMWKQHQAAREEMAAFKEWMFNRYEVEAICKYDDLVASGGNFDALANHRVDEIRRPGDKKQFRKKRVAELRSRRTPGTPGGGLDAECQRLHQTQSEE